MTGRMRSTAGFGAGRRRALRQLSLLGVGTLLGGGCATAARPASRLAESRPVNGRPAVKKLAPLLFDAEGNRQLAGAVLVVEHAGQILHAEAVGTASGLATAAVPDRPLLPSCKMRVASVSKMAVALTAVRLAESGAIDLDEDLRPEFPMLANPAFPEATLTLRQLLAHTSALRDPVDEGYYAISPAPIESILGPTTLNPKAPAGPGSWFEYCNLNFGIVATVLERRTGERFDRLCRRLVLAPEGLTGGFNWSAVPLAERRQGATLYRRFDGEWRVQTDGPEVLAGTGPIGLTEPDFAIDDYEIGRNGTLFSPQGGLRISALELARLARVAGTTPALQTIEWRYARASDGTPNGDSWNGAFLASGLGCFHWTAADSPIPGQRMIGHDGEAYGLYSGAWFLPDLDAAVGFAVTGTPAGPQPPGDSHPGYNRWSQACFDAAASVLGAT